MSFLKRRAEALLGETWNMARSGASKEEVMEAMERWKSADSAARKEAECSLSAKR